MRTYYCICGGRVKEVPGKISECKCGKVFGIKGKVSDHINMRTTWSGQTQIEFNTTTVDKSIEAMNRNKK